MYVNALTTLLACLGLYISLYFTLVHCSLVQPAIRWIPAFCTMTNQTCHRIAQSRQARIFRIPNSLLGIAYYLGLIGLHTSGQPPTHAWLLIERAAAWVAVALGAYLSYALMRQLRTPCRLCYLSHLINLALASILTLTG